ncbi:MAG: 50S ribosomal protein L19 [Verrucomicrobiota bacterium]
MNKVQKIHRENMRADLPDFGPGDTVRVHVIIREGEKERVQVFTGTVLGRNGQGIAESMTVRRVAFGQAVERVFPIHSPAIEKIEVIRRGRIRRAKLYYIRDQVGKAARVSELKAAQ